MTKMSANSLSDLVWMAMMAGILESSDKEIDWGLGRPRI
jgi:hypothetical protein